MGQVPFPKQRELVRKAPNRKAQPSSSSFGHYAGPNNMIVLLSDNKVTIIEDQAGRRHYHHPHYK